MSHYDVFSEEINILLCCATVRYERNRSTKQSSSLYRFHQIIDNHGILPVGRRIKRVNIPYHLKYLDILLKKSESLSLLLDTLMIEMSTKVEETQLTNCDQITTGLQVEVPLLETTGSNPLPLICYAMLCQTKRWQPRPRTCSLDYQGKMERAEKIKRPFHFPENTCHPRGNS